MVFLFKSISFKNFLQFFRSRYIFLQYRYLYFFLLQTTISFSLLQIKLAVISTGLLQLHQLVNYLMLKPINFLSGGSIVLFNDCIQDFIKISSWMTSFFFSAFCINALFINFTYLRDLNPLITYFEINYNIFCFFIQYLFYYLIFKFKANKISFALIFFFLKTNNYINR